MLGLILVISLPLLALHLAVTLLARALRVYSPSRLETLAEAAGRAELSETILSSYERTVRSAEILSVLSGLLLAGLLAAMAHELDAPRYLLLVAGVLVAVGIGRAIAEVFAHVRAERILVRFWPAASVARILVSPVSWLLERAEAGAYRRSSLTHPGPRPQSVELEITQISGELADNETEVELPETTQTLLENAVALAHRSVDEVMTPRSAILAIPASTTPTEAVRSFVDSGFSRLPLFGESRDDIIGILHAKDLFARIIEEPEARGFDLRKMARPPLFVPETKNAAELLEELRARQVQMAIVLDEYGGVAGLITLEDLIEELVGEIHDEYDEPEPVAPITPVGDSRFEVDAALLLDELNDRLGLRLPTGDDYSTIGGLAFSTLGHLPEPGASFLREGIRFTVLEVEGHSIRRVQLDLAPSPTPAARPA